MKHKKSRKRISHFSRKEKVDIFQMCDAKCYDYSYGCSAFRAKGHKLKEAHKSYHDCLNYQIGDYYEQLRSYSRFRARGGV